MQAPLLKKSTCINDLNYRFPDRAFVKQYKKSPNDRFNEAALCFRQLGPENLKWYNILEFIFCGIFLFVPRFVFIVVNTSIIWLISLFAVAGLPPLKEPNVKPRILGWRRYLVAVMYYLMRLNYTMLGVYWIHTKGKKTHQSIAPIDLFVPHTGWLDYALPQEFPNLNRYSPVGKAELSKISFIEAAEALWASRTNEGKKGTSTNILKDTIVGRANYRPDFENNKNDRYCDKILINPQGCCTNFNVLTNFKPGAFIPGVPVQPVYVEHDYGNADLFSWQSIHRQGNTHILKIFCMQLLRLKHTVTYHYLDVYYPNEAEKKDPNLYAHNVRLKIAEFSNLPILDVSMEDAQIVELVSANCKPKNYNYDPNYGIVEFVRLKQTYHCTFRQVKSLVIEYLDKFGPYFPDRKMEIDLATFEQVYGQTLNFDNLPYFDPRFINLASFVEAKLREG